MPETFVVASDFHGDRHDPVARKAFLSFTDDFKPKLRWFAGDLWDFRALRVGASKDEKMASMQADFDAGMEFLTLYRPQVFTLGNHDQRLWDATGKEGLTKTGPVPDFARSLIAEFEALAVKLDMQVLPYDKRKGVFKYKGVKVVHGFDGLRAPNMAAVYGNVFYGHGHRIETGTAPHEESKVAQQVGCLCLLDMDYNRGQLRTLAQEHGWAYGVIERPGKFGYMQARLIDGTVTYAEKMKTVRH